ncbi:MAG: hypothetical protein U0165_03530 [Polyangiaceae bacterium]
MPDEPLKDDEPEDSSASGHGEKEGPEVAVPSGVPASENGDRQSEPPGSLVPQRPGQAEEGLAPWSADLQALTALTQSPSNQAVFASKTYRGPLPPAAEFKGYGEVLDTAPTRILALLETEQGHRQTETAKMLGHLRSEETATRKHQQRRNDRRDRREDRGQHMGFVIVISALVAGTLVALKAPEKAVPVVLVFFGLAGLTAGGHFLHTLWVGRRNSVEPQDREPNEGEESPKPPRRKR